MDKNDENKSIIKNIYLTLEEAQAQVDWNNEFDSLNVVLSWLGVIQYVIRQFKVQIWNSGKISGWE